MIHGVMRGVDVVITTAHSAQGWGGDNPQTVDLEGNLLEAAKAAGMKQFVFPLCRTGRCRQPYPILVPEVYMDLWLGVVIDLSASS
jgi:hypothetical protein